MSAKIADVPELKPILGLRSPAHSFDRMLNPFAAPCLLQGVFHPPYMKLHRAGVEAKAKALWLARHRDRLAAGRDALARLLLSAFDQSGRL